MKPTKENAVADEPAGSDRVSESDGGDDNDRDLLFETVDLEHALIIDGKKVEQLRIREPIGEDLVACGFPITFTKESHTINGRRMTDLIGSLAGIAVADVHKLVASDWMKCAVIIGEFCGIDLELTFPDSFLMRA